MTKQQDSKDTDLDAVNRSFMAQCNTCGALFASKNREYDNAIVRTGVLGAVVEIIGAAARLPVMVLRSPEHGRSRQAKLIDVLMDIHNYATIALLHIADNNWEGK